MNPRSPPARPHIGIHLSHFSTKTTNEWGEDDAWDSTSDSESPRQSTLTSSWNRSSISSAPKKAPRTPSPSSSNLAFSYTHVNAPNPSSYPPKPELMAPQAAKNGWTIVRTSHNNESKINQRTDTAFEQDGDPRDIDVEGDMILGDLEAEMSATDMDVSIAPLASNSKPKHSERAIRQDISDIVNGILSSINQVLHPTLAHKAVSRFFKIL
jgi:hypothetical protein